MTHWIGCASRTAVWLAGIVAASCSLTGASAAEACRFVGTTDPAGHVAVTANVDRMEGVMRVDVTLTFETTRLVWLPFRYLVEEISFWRGEQLQSVAVNIRTLVGSHVVRQQWDRFERAPDGLHAYRVQAKSIADFQRRHPGFVRHWSPTTFGQPWLSDYAAAAPERRPDLDLRTSPLPSDLRSPLALAFYWDRWLPRTGEEVSVFLPGFKADRLVHLTIEGVSESNGAIWRTRLHHPALSQQPGSTAMAWTSADGSLKQLAFEVHAATGSAHGLIQQMGCEGMPVRP